MISFDYAALLPILIVTGVGSLLPLIGAFGTRVPSGRAGRGQIRARPGLLAGIAATGLVVAIVLTLASVFAIPGLSAHGSGTTPTSGFMPFVGTPADPASDLIPAKTVLSFTALELTPFVVLFELVFLAVALMVVIASPRYISSRHQGEYYALILLSTVGMMVVAASTDLITLFVGLELSSFCTYALAGFFKRRIDSTEAAMKYFLIGSISSSLAIFGISIVYGLTGSTSFGALASLWGTPLHLAAGGSSSIGEQLIQGRFTLGVFVWGLLLAGFGYKIALVPFHNYAVDVYEGAPDTVSGFVAAGGKQMGFAALFKVFLLGLFAVKANWDVMVGVIAIVTMIVGNVAALQQTNIKRMLAYSSIAQAGYILMALAVGSEYAMGGGLFHIVTYAFMKAGAFLALAAVATWGIGEELSDWKGMGRRAPFVAFCMTLFMLSFAGIPPLAGFASKFVLFSGSIQAGIAAPGIWWQFWVTPYPMLYFGLAIVGIVTSAISLVYYWRVIRVMYVEEGEGRRMQVAPSAAIAVFIAAAGVVLIGLFPAVALGLSQDAAHHIMALVAP